MSCETEAAKVWERPKDPDEAVQYSVDFGPDVARRWKPDHSYASGVHLQPRRANGYDYECTTPGRTGFREPVWPTTVGSTVNDGSVVWTCRAPSTASNRVTITGTPTWAPDSGLTVAGVTVDGSETFALLSGGTDGENYTVVVTALTTDGQTLKQVCILKVRRAVFVCET